MALTKCRECGRPVSDRADTCPHCGASRERWWQQEVISWPAIIALLLLAVIALMLLR